MDSLVTFILINGKILFKITPCGHSICNGFFLFVCLFYTQFLIFYKHIVILKLYFENFWRLKSHPLLLFMATIPDVNCSKLRQFTIRLFYFASLWLPEPVCTIYQHNPETDKVCKQSSRALLWFHFTMEVYLSTQTQLGPHAIGFRNKFVSFQFEQGHLLCYKHILIEHLRVFHFCIFC